jgi:hypothetical protein
MGEWKEMLYLRCAPGFRGKLQEWADKERRSLSSTGALLIEWAFEQLKSAGTIQELLEQKIAPPEPNHTAASLGAKSSRTPKRK